MNYKKLGFVRIVLGYFNNSQIVRFYFSTNKKLTMNKCFLKNAKIDSYGIVTPKMHNRIIKTGKTFCDIESFYKLPCKNTILNYIYLMLVYANNHYVEIWGK